MSLHPGAETAVTSRHELPSLRERLRHSLLVLDGAMGTSLNERGLAFQDCFEAACLDRPDDVRAIHAAFLAAGAQGLQTNTFGANRYKLDKHHRERDLERILEAAAALAREAAAGRAHVLGAIGPLGPQIEPLGRIGRLEARLAFREVAAVLAPLIDGFSLETFSCVEEAVECVRGIREVSDLPVIAHVTVVNSGRTLLGSTVEQAAEALAEAGADAIGLNCSTGPRAVLEGIQRMAAVCDLPLSARPNAGMPREVDGRVFFESSPDYFGRFARRFFQAGGRIVGGCCGTTPEHIRALAGAARAFRAGGRIEPPPVHARPRAEVVAERPLQPLPLAERSRLGRALAGDEGPISVELLPPATPDTSRLVEAACALREGGATCVNLPDGPRASARLSNTAAAVIIQRDAGIEALVHFCCRDRNLLGMQSDLMGAEALGLRNLLVITGDPPYRGNYPEATAVFDVDAIGLCNIVDHLNHGLDLGGNAMRARTNFCFGAALNHTAGDLERELARARWKILAGVDFLITQPVFDLGALEHALSRLPADHPPVLAGIWPLRSLRNAEFLASEVPGVVVPPAVLERMRAADEAGRAEAEGLAIAVETLERAAPLVAGFQLAAPFNRVEPALELLAAAHALA
ncbi:MAG: bifunctional homocysteine S-methyltransferase/methylenetetrahydrofolate reductase [Planctomycetota bacterium]|nr:MAG: bifunctional homocysteine S-methyltransferase/methylenetetrahydrofolate reductase [Planctomycetota bacterium]